ncbi:MAG: coenzyme F420-0:L-glutamate ligase [Candidatus Bathyarchaeota archaeon]|nr:MAG: coenzyme F420-0:L-glutamate ligase [Candidatus Bathyarchaeota archaeon]
MVETYKAVTVATHYWRPGDDYLRQLVDAIENRIENRNVVAISEKAISIAMGNIVDESVVKPRWKARFLAKYWMRYIWGYFLGSLCHLRKTTIRHLRGYPLKEGSAHKQLVLEHAGLLQALMFGSEGGIDGSNLPYSYVSLPLRNASETAHKIRSYIKSKLGKSVTVMIVDTDKTYSIRGFHFTPRPKPINGIDSFGGFLAHVLGRLLKLKRRATPIAVAGLAMHVEKALEIAEIANRVRGFGAGRTVWDMAKTFDVSITGVTWDMLDAIKHRPIVVVTIHK